MVTKKRFRDYSKMGQWGIPVLCVGKTDEIINAGDERGIVQVEIKINGVEVDFESIMGRLEEEFESAVKKEAGKHISKAVSDKLADIMNTLYNIESQAECLQQDLEQTVGF